MRNTEVSHGVRAHSALTGSLSGRAASAMPASCGLADLLPPVASRTSCLGPRGPGFPGTSATRSACPASKLCVWPVTRGGCWHRGRRERQTGSELPFTRHFWRTPAHITRHPRGHVTSRWSERERGWHGRFKPHSTRAREARPCGAWASPNPPQSRG